MVGDFSQLRSASPQPRRVLPRRSSVTADETLAGGPRADEPADVARVAGPGELEASLVGAAVGSPNEWEDAKTALVDSGPLPVGREEPDDDAETTPVDPDDLERLRIEPRPGVPRAQGKETRPMGSSSSPDVDSGDPAFVRAGGSGARKKTMLASESGALGRRTMLANESGALGRRTMLANESGPLGRRTMLASESGPLGRRTMLASESGPLVERVSPSNENVPVVRPASPSSSIELPTSRGYATWVVALVMVSVGGAVAAGVLWWPQIRAFLGR